MIGHRVKGWLLHLAAFVAAALVLLALLRGATLLPPSMWRDDPLSPEDFAVRFGVLAILVAAAIAVHGVLMHRMTRYSPAKFWVLKRLAFVVAVFVVVNIGSFAGIITPLEATTLSLAVVFVAGGVLLVRGSDA